MSAQTSTPETRAGRLAELADLGGMPAARERIARAQPIIEAVTEATGGAPGLYLDENGDLEVRWVVPQSVEHPAQIVSVAFGEDRVEGYIFSRASETIHTDIDVPVDDPRLTELITAFVHCAIHQHDIEWRTRP